MNTQSHTIPQQRAYPHEYIAVVPRDILFANTYWQGIKRENTAHLLTLMTKHMEFHARPTMENDPRYKQIIPYVIFKHHDRFFLMQRTAHASEQRLQSNYTLGIGGHMRANDLQGTDVFGWAQREFHEEVDYQGQSTISTLGILNDDSNDVGKVHLGIVLLINAQSDAIRVRSELKSGVLAPLSEIESVYPLLENWSKVIFHELGNVGNGTPCCCI